MSNRTKLINNWLTQQLKTDHYDLKLLAGDASFRSYYRVIDGEKSYILMDAPPELECCKSFIKIDQFLVDNNVHAPKIIHKGIQEGLLLLEDFGDEVLLKILSPNNADNYYHQAIDIICQLQQCQMESTLDLPEFDETLIHKELELFREWFLGKLVQYEMSDEESKIIDNVFARLTKDFLAQSYSFTHRDFHSRNLMRLENDTLGVLDFQDAVHGPKTYDLVSLLKDAYIAWPREKQEQWLNYYYDQACTQGLLNNYTIEQLFYDYEITGLQRHIKVVGIFARLYKRDGKDGYLQDIPRVMNYIIDALSRINQFNDFYQLMAEKFIPAFEQTDWTEGN